MANLSLLKELGRIKKPETPVISGPTVMDHAELMQLTKAKMVGYAEDRGYVVDEDGTKSEIADEIVAAGG